MSQVKASRRGGSQSVTTPVRAGIPSMGAPKRTSAPTRGSISTVDGNHAARWAGSLMARHTRSTGWG